MNIVLACVDETEPEPCPYAEPESEPLTFDPVVNVNRAERTMFFVHVRMTFVVSRVSISSLSLRYW
jgi:hypothetical protein